MKRSLAATKDDSDDDIWNYTANKIKNLPMHTSRNVKVTDGKRSSVKISATPNIANILPLRRRPTSTKAVNCGQALKKQTKTSLSVLGTQLML